MASSPSSKRVIRAIMIALAIWGLYLAIGATGYFTEESLFDIRKSFIVAIASTSFLMLWVFVLNSVDRRRVLLEQGVSGIVEAPDPSVSSTNIAPPTWSRAGLATLGIGLFGLLLWGIAILVCPVLGEEADPAADRTMLVVTTILGWLAAISMVCSATAGMVALANPQRLKGKWLGVLGLAFCVGSLFGFVIRMNR